MNTSIGIPTNPASIPVDLPIDTKEKLPLNLRNTKCSLHLNELRLQVKLGCGAEERQNPQFVRFDIQIRFQAIPEGCFTDRIEDTLCYAKISEILKDLCDREYQLIEHLGMEAFSKLVDQTPANSYLKLCLTKERPPIEGLEGGASFTLENGL